MTVLNQIFRLRTRGIFKKLKILSFSSEARHTVTRITLFQFADTTSMSVPLFKDFSGARESASSPAFNKDQRSYSFRPKNTQIVSLPTAPRQSPRHPINRQVRRIPETRQQGTAENLPQQCCAAAERGTEWYRHKSHLQHIALKCENLTRGRGCRPQCGPYWPYGAWQLRGKAPCD